MKKYMKLNLILGISSVFGFILLLNILPKVGAIYTHDSVAYTYGAKSLLNGQGLKYFGYKTPIIQWPPLYSLLLVIPTAIGLEISRFVIFFNSFLFAFILFISGKWFYEHLKSKMLVYLGVIFIMFSIPIIHISRFIWTEPLFILLLITSLICFEKYLEKYSMKWLIISGLISSICWLTRYTGITVLITCCLLILIYRKSIKNKLIDLFIYGSLSAIPMAVWVIRNIILSNTITGGRTIKRTSIINNIKKTLHIFYSWFTGEEFRISIIGIISLTLIVIISIIILIMRKRSKEIIRGCNKGFIEFLIFSMLYFIILIHSASKYAMDPLNDRLWSPIYIPLIFVTFYIIDIIVNNLIIDNKLLIRCFKISVYISLIIIVSYQIKYYISNRHSFHLCKIGTAYSEHVTNSETIHYINNNSFEDDAIIFGNNPSILTYHTDFDSRWTPKKNGIEIYGFDQFEQTIETSNNLYIAWFGDTNSNTFYTINDISKHYSVELVKKLSDGVIYRINSSN
ncbi:MAG: glycosyltransferase family 39 protein [Vallitalea sp.]|jgi:hypothetical protein|nr:glycosyltransferase family 39 protein [Vallitalea sp.]